jgi:hypothetical protein
MATEQYKEYDEEPCSAADKGASVNTKWSDNLHLPLTCGNNIRFRVIRSDFHSSRFRPSW